MKTGKITFVSIAALTLFSLGLGSQAWGWGEMIEEVQWECYVIHGNGSSSNTIIVDYGMVWDPSICEYYHNLTPNEDIIVGTEVIEHRQNVEDLTKKLSL